MRVRMRWKIVLKLKHTLMNVGSNESQHSQMIFPLWELESCDVMNLRNKIIKNSF